MNPEIHTTKPGKCPKRGTNLIKEKTKLGNKSVQNMFTIAFLNLKHSTLLLKAVRLLSFELFCSWCYIISSKFLRESTYE